MFEDTVEFQTAMKFKRKKWTYVRYILFGQLTEL